MTEQQEEKAQVRKKRKQVFIYGNYSNYYGYRIDRRLSEDPRLDLLKKEWFEGKHCLDIGCNQGVITISIAKRFSCRSILGIDIDPDLIEAAYRNLRRISRTECPSSRLMKTSEPPISNADNTVEHSISKFSGGEKVVLPAETSHLEEGISFRRENFIETLQGGKEKYDTILCFSVTKWIHLNWGDDGLISLFVKIWRLLRPGGILLLEPQPWSSYRSNRQVSEIAKLNYNNILFTPDVFQEILLDKIGFRSMTNIGGVLSGTTIGFDRPIYVINK